MCEVNGRAERLSCHFVSVGVSVCARLYVCACACVLGGIWISYIYNMIPINHSGIIQVHKEISTKGQRCGPVFHL